MFIPILDVTSVHLHLSHVLYGNPLRFSKGLKSLGHLFFEHLDILVYNNTACTYCVPTCT